MALSFPRVHPLGNPLEPTRHDSGLRGHSLKPSVITPFTQHRNVEESKGKTPHSSPRHKRQTNDTHMDVCPRSPEREARARLETIADDRNVRKKAGFREGIAASNHWSVFLFSSNWSLTDSVCWGLPVDWLVPGGRVCKGAGPRSCSRRPRPRRGRGRSGAGRRCPGRTRCRTGASGLLLETRERHRE